MSEGLAVFILVNNYFHDIATAMFLASGVAMRVLVKNAEGKKTGAVIGCFYDLPCGMRRLGRFSLYWILFGAYHGYLHSGILSLNMRSIKIRCPACS